MYSCFIKNGFLTVLALLLGAQASGQQASEQIRLNQLGFYPTAEKVAVVLGENVGDSFVLKTADGKKTVFSGQLSQTQETEFSKRPTRIADFSSFNKPGTYVLEVSGMGQSYAFEIKKEVHKAVADASLKGFYYIRASTPLPEKWAGKWARPAGHPDTNVLVHASAASPQRPEGTVLAAPRGWYDAGDYNKYVVNSGITTGTLLSAYEDFPEFFRAQKLNIPESSNKVPDILDEVLWNLRWMLAMQDPHDGGVYHKLTTPAFEGMIMPAEARKQRYVIQKTTAAALDFAAVLAQASRVYKGFGREYPGLADSCLTAATRAWEWARKNPAVLYDQNAMNEKFEPKVTTGAYGDRERSDEFIWAAAELYTTTKDNRYYEAVNLLPDLKMPLPSWAQVRLLGYYTLLRHEKSLTPLAQKSLPELKKRVLAFADSLMEGAHQRAYRTVMGKTQRDYIWGSSAVAANQAIGLIQAFKLSGDKKYLRAALTNVDYLLGRNATGYSFVTGWGDKPIMHPHHRPSVADGIAEPVPGLLSGGPNARAAQQDKCGSYPSAHPDEVFIDHDCSYASNEIAINWNAPLVYVLSAVEALQQHLRD